MALAKKSLEDLNSALTLLTVLTNRILQQQIDFEQSSGMSNSHSHHVMYYDALNISNNGIEVEQYSDDEVKSGSYTSYDIACQAYNLIIDVIQRESNR